jgi:stage V sporulation protein B
MKQFIKHSKNHPLVMGTLVLTATGFISRIIGFFYRIYLARLFGEEGMGIYQLLSPVLAIAFSLSAAAFQTAISKSVAEQAAFAAVCHPSTVSTAAHLPGTAPQAAFKPLLAGLSLSVPLSLLCAFFVYSQAEWIGSRLLNEARTVSMLRILAFSLPLSAVHSCINGYFYGIKKTGFPAIAQLFEQLVRVGCVFVLCNAVILRGELPGIEIAVAGLALGELASMILSVGAAYLYYAKSCKTAVSSLSTGALASVEHFAAGPLYRSLLAMVLPLTANRLVLNLMQSLETVSIPTRLKLYGYDTSTALSVYGVLTGMAMPLIFFPCALTGSVSVLLLPIISEKYALGNLKEVRRTTFRTIKYTAMLGIPCLLLFVILGRWAGPALFDSALAGHFITTLGFICPFIYLGSTLSSILNGLGLTKQLFVMNVTALLIRLLFVYLAIPKVGITGYLWGLLVSQLLLTLLYLWCLYHFLHKNHKKFQ